MRQTGWCLVVAGILLMLASFVIGFGPRDLNVAIGRYVEIVGTFSLVPIVAGGALLFLGRRR